MRIAAISAPFRRFASLPVARPLLRVAGWIVLGFYFGFALLVLALRYAILPQIDNYRGDIETALTRALKLPVGIRHIDAGWAGLRPRLAIRGLEVRDAQGRPALGLDEVQAELSWSSLLLLELRLHRLEIVAPQLDIRRDKVGHVFVAGLEIEETGADTGVGDWILAQERIVVRDAAIRWNDELRAAPPLTLARVNFDLRNDGSRHLFGLTGEPPPSLAARLDLRGDVSGNLRGSGLDKFAAWRGETYVEIDNADFAVWRTWIDYPVDLPRGHGALRLWLAFKDGRATGATADVRLADLQLRLGPDLPLLNVGRIEGRVKAQRRSGGYEVETRGLTLTAHGGIHVGPTDFHLRYRAALGVRPAAGEVEANGLDIGALAALSAYVPLDDALRAGLAAYAPRGRFKELKAAWSSAPDGLKSWRAKASFDNFGLAAVGSRPGFSGLSGSLDGDDKSGNLALTSVRSALDLPVVFADPRLVLDDLSADVRWKIDANGLDLQLARAVFHNADAAGEASGHYRLPKGGGAGKIDLAAKLTRAAGNTVWRYMPLVVNQDVRDWLKDSLVGGIADEATLRLKGDLAKFPFANGKDGIFQVKGRFHGAMLNYAPGWPEIRDIEGDLLFEGVRMLIQGRKGRILGVGIGPVTAEIADLSLPEELLVIEGRAAGATADFLKFVEASPVGARIEHFTEGMQAVGQGQLRLRLDMPLRRIDETGIDGRFRFINDQLLLDPDMPPLTDVNGELHFTGDRIEAQKIRAAILGTPLIVDVATTADGSVAAKAAGTLAVRPLAQQFGLPLLESLSGSAQWNGTVKVKKKSAEVRIESNLQGIASALPEPFNKTTRETLPLVVERKQAPAGRSILNFSLGNAVKATLVRRNDDGRMIVERGGIGVGAPLRVPERGVLFAAQAKRIDVDAWRRLAGGGGRGNGGKDDGGEGPFPVSQIDVRADELVAFGRTVTGLRLAATRNDGVWKAELKSRDASGNLEWDGKGAGRISGHLSQLSIPEPVAGHATDSADIPDEMPAVDLAVDRFTFQEKDFGAVKFKAENAADGYWNARFDVRNDDFTVDGSGRWRPAHDAAATHAQFKLATKSIERSLTRLGYPDVVRRGTANLEGTLSWKGSPMDIDYPSLDGTLRFEAFSGQFKKGDPGVGRLLGVLSLQSLPRRLTLDFRDVFSEGFAFDGIGGEAVITRGIMETKNLQMVGPAAKVLMTGNIDLAAETLHLKVRVRPALGESIATGVLLTNPAAGAAAWVFNKIFGNPFDVAFGHEFTMTGPWADPRVEKTGQPGGVANDGPNVAEEPR